MVEFTENLFLSWEEVHKSCKELARQMHGLKEWKGLICVTRGGLVPAGIICRELGIRLVETLCIQNYDYQTQKDTRAHKQPQVEAKGAGWLVIDDLSDTGDTFRFIRRALPEAHYACPYVKPKGKEETDSFVHAIDQHIWIHFPWDTSLQPQLPIAGKGAA